MQDNNPNPSSSNAKNRLIYPPKPPLTPHICWVNFLLGGIAQIVFGQTEKGIAILAIWIVSIFIPPLSGLINVLSVIDAYLIGAKLKSGKPVKKWEFFPSNLEK